MINGNRVYELHYEEFAGMARDGMLYKDRKDIVFEKDLHDIINDSKINIISLHYLGHIKLWKTVSDLLYPPVSSQQKIKVK